MKKLVLFLSLMVPALAFGQPYQIKWYKIAGGGGISASGGYAVTGTLGQAEAGAAMTGGNYSMTGGFWSLYAVPTQGAPTLQMTNAAPGFATIWWTPSTPGFVLQETPSLSPPNWVLSATGTNNPATVPATGPARFYRLSKP